MRRRHNDTADALSHNGDISSPYEISFKTLAVAQQEDPELQGLGTSNNSTVLVLEEVSLPLVPTSIIFATSNSPPRLFVRVPHCIRIFGSSHSLSPPGFWTTERLIKAP